MSDAEIPPAVGGLPVDAFGDQLEAIQDALVTLAELGIDVSEISMGVQDDALGATIRLDGEQLVEAGFPDAHPGVSIGSESPGGEPAAVSDTADAADDDRGVEDEEASDATDSPTEATDADEDAGIVPDEVVEDPQTTADHRLAIATLVGLDEYLDYDGDKPPQFSKSARINIACDATSLDEDRLDGLRLGSQAELAVVAHGFDADIAERQYYVKDQLQKIYRQLTDEATAPGVPDEYTISDPEPEHDSDSDQDTVDESAGADDESDRIEAEPGGGRHLALEGINLRQDVTVDDIESAVAEAETPTEVAQELRISRSVACRAIGRLDLSDQLDVHESELLENAREALDAQDEGDSEPEWVETGGTDDAGDGPAWSDYATDGGAVASDDSSGAGPRTLAERLDAMDCSASIPDEVSLAEFEAAVEEHTHLREAAAALEMDPSDLRVIVYKLGWYGRLREGRPLRGGARE